MTPIDGPETPGAGDKGSVTRWLSNLKRGDAAAAYLLWNRYGRRLVGRARKALGNAPRGMADEEDAALNAFHGFLAGVDRGRYPQLRDRAGLWRLLAVITAHKAIEQVRDETRKKRGGTAPAGAGPGGDPDELAAPEPSPDLAVLWAEECRLRLARLGDPTLVQIAELRLARYSNVEIADRLGLSKASVDRKLETIREKWLAG